LAQLHAWWRAANYLAVGMIYLSGPGHGAPGVLGPTYLDGSYS